MQRLSCHGADCVRLRHKKEKDNRPAQQRSPVCGGEEPGTRFGVRIAVLGGQTEPSIPRGRVVKAGSSNSYHREVRGSIPGGWSVPPSSDPRCAGEKNLRVRFGVQGVVLGVSTVT